MVENFVGQWLLLRNIPERHSRPQHLPDLRREPEGGVPARVGALRRARDAGRRQPRRPARRRLHVRQRAARRALRHPRRLRQPLPQGDPRPSAGRPAGARRASHRHLVPEPDVAGAQGQVGAREPARHAPAPAAARRTVVPRAGAGRRPRDGPRAARDAPREPRVRRLPRADGSLWGSRSRTSTPSAGGGRRTATRPSTRGGPCPPATPSRASTACGRCSWTTPGPLVRTVTEKLLAYALGRRIEHYDYPTIRKIARDAAADGHRWSAVVLGIVDSPPFQLRSTGS